MGRRMLVAGLAAAGLMLGASTASAEVRTGQVADPQGDSTVTLDGRRLIDLQRVAATYDDQTGSLTVRVEGLLPLFSQYASTHVGMSVGTSCASTSSGAYQISASWYSEDYGYADGYAELAVDGRYVGAGSAHAEGGTLVIGFQGLDLVRRDLRCVGATVATTGDPWGSGADDAAGFCLVAGCAAAPPRSDALLDVKPPALYAGTYSPGSTIRGVAEFRNTSGAPVRIRHGILTARPPGNTHVLGPVKYDFQPQLRGVDVPANSARVAQQSFTLPADAPLGRYEVYATYRDRDGIYHDGPSVFVDVVAPGSPPPSRGGGGDAPPPSGGGGGGGGGTTQPASPTPVTGVGQPGAPPTVVTVEGGLDVRVSGARGGLAALRTSALRIPLRCSEGCEVRGRLTRGGRTYARGEVSRLRAGQATLRLRATRSQRRALRRLRGATTFTLRLTFEDRQGERTVSTTRLRLR